MGLVTCKEERIDPEGDLILVVGQNLQPHPGVVTYFQVSESALRFASRVWRQLPIAYHDHDTRSIMGVRRKSYMPDDDPAALRILLLIAHLQFKRVPRRLPTETLVNVAKLCHKYEAKDLVHVYKSQWTTDSEWDDATYCDSILWIGWCFDWKEHDGAVRRALKQVVTECSPDQGSQLSLPPLCKETILLIMASNTAQICKLFNLLMEATKTIDFACGRLVCSLKDRNQCVAQRAGAITLCFREFFLCIQDGSNNTSHNLDGTSLTTLLQVVQEMHARALRPINGAVHFTCCEPMIQFKKTIREMSEAVRDTKLQPTELSDVD